MSRNHNIAVATGGFKNPLCCIDGAVDDTVQLAQGRPEDDPQITDNQQTQETNMTENQACELGAKAYEASAAALRDPSKAKHAAASLAHQAASDAFDQVPKLFRETGIHSKIAAYHLDNVQEAPEGQVNDRITAAAKAYGKAHGITDHAQAMSAYLHTTEGSREYGKFRDQIVIGRGR